MPVPTLSGSIQAIMLIQNRNVQLIHKQQAQHKPKVQKPRKKNLNAVMIIFI